MSLAHRRDHRSCARTTPHRVRPHDMINPLLRTPQ
ncbi:hypothetical protein Ae331Ps2_5028 [Pseudonocardia sp. Ae331_Ps2]|nr:hypothetical protein Ae331Ps2_5028 [Pseudonocardia sp. Ae331_Ps2]